MRRKLIQQDAFEKIISESVSTSQHELSQAEEIMARAIGKDLKLNSFNDAVVVYETNDGTFVHANYEIKNGKVSFNEMQELVIDEESRNTRRKGLIGEILESLLDSNTATTPKAQERFRQYTEMINWKSYSNKSRQMKKAAVSEATQIDFKGAEKQLVNAYHTATNVLDYVKYMEVGPALQESVVKRDDRGNITNLMVPDSKMRNEGKMLHFDWKTLNHKVKVLRDGASSLVENQDFCKAVVNLKRQNAFSDGAALEDALDHVVKHWPEVLYVTQPELSGIVSETLNLAGEKNYDDDTCTFMAEGILRRASEAYVDRVNQLLHLASAPKLENGVDPYIHFQSTVEPFFASIDEKFGLEKKAFADLYESLEYVWTKADRRGDEGMKHEVAGHLHELAAILNNESKPDLGVAQDAASWLKNIIETNLAGGKWNVSNKPHTTVSGDHPAMAEKARQKYSPAADLGGDAYGDPLPQIAQDSMGYKGGKNSRKTRSDSWGNEGGKDVFPSLKNPYVPKPFGDYTGTTKGVDKETFGQHGSTWQSKETWPSLHNPYVPKEAGGPGGKGYKATVDDKDLVVNK